MLLVKNEVNKGICLNFEYAASLAHGDLVFSFGGDDISRPDRVAQVYAEWTHSQCAAIACGGRLINTNSEIFGDIGREVMLGPPVGAFVAYDKRVFSEFPPLGKDICAETYEDCVYGGRAKMLSGVKYLDSKLVDYRIGSGKSTSGSVRLRRIKIIKASKSAYDQLIQDAKFLAVRGYADANSKIEQYEKEQKKLSAELLLVSGRTFRIRLHGYCTYGFNACSWRFRVYGMIFLLPLNLCDMLLFLYGFIVRSGKIKV